MYPLRDHINRVDLSKIKTVELAMIVRSHIRVNTTAAMDVAYALRAAVEQGQLTSKKHSAARKGR